MRIPATLQKIRNRCRNKKHPSESSPFGPKRSKSAPFYFQDFNTEDLELLTNGYSTPPRKSARYSCATPDSSASTPGLSRKSEMLNRIPCARNLTTQTLGRSEPIMRTSTPEPIRQTSLGVIANKRLRRPDRPISMNPFIEDKRGCCGAEDCVLCTLVRPEFRGRHLPRINNPSFVRNFDWAVLGLTAIFV